MSAPGTYGAEHAVNAITPPRDETLSGILAEREDCAFAVETVSGFGDPETIEACARAVRDRSDPTEREARVHLTMQRYAELLAIEKALEIASAGAFGSQETATRFLRENVRLRAAIKEAALLMTGNFQRPTADWQRVLPLLQAALDHRPLVTRVRHVKRGTEYTILGQGELQDANGQGLPEGATLVVYAGDDGRLWLRAFGEFNDGRFERIREASDAG